MCLQNALYWRFKQADSIAAAMQNVPQFNSCQNIDSFAQEFIFRFFSLTKTHVLVKRPHTSVFASLINSYRHVKRSPSGVMSK